MKAHFEQFARYNQWANRRLYAVAAQLTDAQYREDRGAFFRSVRGTLNHLLVADRVWLHRIEGTGPVPSALDEILHDGFDDLRAAREAEDERIIRVVAEQEEPRFGADLHYRSMNGQAFAMPFAAVLSHLFNHQTHHRGQAHTLLSQFGLAAPSIDLLYFLQGK